MHEGTERALARLIFVLACAVPTFVLLSFIVFTWTPWHHAIVRDRAANELTLRCGLDVQLASFRRTAPGRYLVGGVILTDPETGLDVARVRRAEWVHDAGRGMFILHQAELYAESLPAAWRMFHDRFLRRPEWTDDPLRVAAADVTIHAPGGGLTIRDVEGWVETIDDVVQAKLRCTPPGGGREPLTISAMRIRSSSPTADSLGFERAGPTTRWMIDTGGGALPCPVLAAYLPAAFADATASPLGQSPSRFRGTMTWSGSGDDWTIDLSGSHFESLSLDALMQSSYHRLSGRADLNLTRCRIRPGDRVDVVGTFIARDGAIGRSLLIASLRHLKTDVRMPEGDSDVPFDRIALAFRVKNSELFAEGVCGREPGYESLGDHVVLTTDGHALVRTLGEKLPATALISTLSPPNSPTVPISKQSLAALRLLMPPALPLEPTFDEPPKIRTARTATGSDVLMTQPK